MRPSSIRAFEILYWLSIISALIGIPLNFAANLQMMYGFGASPRDTELYAWLIGIQVATSVGVLVFAVIIPAILCVLAAHKASNVARWIIVILGVIGFAMLVLRIVGLGYAFTTPMLGLSLTVAGIVNGIIGGLIHMAALVFLFTSGSRLWFATPRQVTPPGMT